MYKKALGGILTIILLISSCDTSTEGEKQNDPIESGSLLEEMRYRQVAEEDENCGKEECTRIEIKFPAFTNERLNQSIEEKVKSEVSNYIREEKGLMDLSDYVSEFISDYKVFKKEFPDAVTPWYLNLEAKTIHGTDSWVSLKVTTESYTGGAHSNTELKFLLFDKNGKILDPLTFISDRNSLTTEAEKAFKKAKGIDENTSWENTDYIFEDNEFQLPENIGYTAEEVILYYNNYEISSYAEGPTEIILPYNEIPDLIEFK